MRILMLTQFYWPQLGGIEQHVRTLSSELLARGHDVAIITQATGDLASFEIDNGTRIYRIRSSMDRLPWLFGNDDRRHAPPFPDPELTQRIRQIIAKEQPDIVHAHNWISRSFLSLKKWSNARLVVTLHDYSLTCPNHHYIHQGQICSGPGFRKCLQCASAHYGPAKGIPIALSNRIVGHNERNKTDVYLAVSQAVASYNELPSGKTPFAVIPNFLPDRTSEPEIDTTPYTSQLPPAGYLLFVGALGKLKGVDILLQAYARLTNAPPLVLIGYSVPGWENLIAQRPPNVHIFTNWPHQAVMQAWERSSLAIVPSVWAEPFGIVAIEAMSMGKPVIASRIGGLTDIIIDQENGLFVSPGDIEAWRYAIQSLLDDPARIARMGQMALQHSTSFGASTIVSRIEQIYQSLLPAVRKEEDQHPNIPTNVVSTPS